MDKYYIGYYKTAIGLLEIKGTESAVTELKFVEVRRAEYECSPYLDLALRQIAEYFRGERQVFDLNLSLDGTPFQQSVWEKLLTVEYGSTASYKDIAGAIGNPAAVRAVGMANNRNPVSIIVPCHRIIGSNGKLVGYGGGLWRKEWLLGHEGAQLNFQSISQ